MTENKSTQARRLEVSSRTGFRWFMTLAVAGCLAFTGCSEKSKRTRGAFVAATGTTSATTGTQATPSAAPAPSGSGAATPAPAGTPSGSTGAPATPTPAPTTSNSGPATPASTPTAPANGSSSGPATPAAPAGSSAAPAPAPAAPQITRISPDSGEVTGGTVVEIEGDGFTSVTDTKVNVGTEAGTVLDVRDPQHMTILTPPYRAPMEASIEVVNSNGRAFASLIFTYTPDTYTKASTPTPTTATPAAPAAGGFTASALPGGIEDTRGIVTGDLDGDGDLDLFCANVGQNQILINDGSGQFTDETLSRLPALFDDTSAAAIADLDADGDLDIVVAAGVQTTPKVDEKRLANYILVNDGTGRFSRADSFAKWDRAFTTDVEIADLTGDGRPDILFANRGYPQKFLFLTSMVGRANRLYVQDKKGKFQPWSYYIQTGEHDTSDFALGDLDGDGDLDAYVTNFSLTDAKGAENQVAKNNGKGWFTVGRGFIAWITRQKKALPSLPKDQSTRSILLDVDGDGDLDALVTNLAGQDGKGEKSYVLLNDGKGRFDRPDEAYLDPAPSAQGGAAGDLDGDGRPDVVLLCEMSVNLYLNDGKNLVQQAAAPTPFFPASVTLADLDGDGKLDIILGQMGPNSVLFNR